MYYNATLLLESAARLGIEPRFPLSESGCLPLADLAKLLTFKQYFKNEVFSSSCGLYIVQKRKPPMHEARAAGPKIDYIDSSSPSRNKTPRNAVRTLATKTHA